MNKVNVQSNRHNPEPVEGSLSKGACRREPVEGITLPNQTKSNVHGITLSLSKGACRRARPESIDLSGELKHAPGYMTFYP